jgi:hypothetical protein
MKMDAEQVTDIAIAYLKKAGYTWIKITKVISDEPANRWKVYADIGAILPAIKTITIDDRDGKIIGYE